MKAFVRDRYGSPDVLELRDVDTPAVTDDGVLVRIRASSLNQADLDYLYGRPLLTRMGTGFRGPKSRGLGLDVAGQVEAVGRNVTAFRPGDEVFGDLTEFGYGAFAEYAAAPERAWAHKPASMSFEQAATVPQSGILALQGLRSGERIGPGQRVLINGASGNMGPFAVQIARALGAHVTGVSSTAKMDFVRSLGADAVIDYSREDYTRSAQRYDWILDAAGNRSLLQNRGALRRRGRYVMVGGPTRRIFGSLLLGPLVSLADSRTLGLDLWWKPFKQEDVVILKRLIDDGSIKPVIDRIYPLAALPDGLRYLEAGRAQGKIVITMSEPSAALA
jgi:NADPH:quinone reductase-like Zn-dependent oxidoreductase